MPSFLKRIEKQFGQVLDLRFVRPKIRNSLNNLS